MSRHIATLLLAACWAGFSACEVARAEPSKPREVAVFFAARDLAAGEVVNVEDLEQRRVPVEWVTASSVKVASDESVVRKTVQLPVLKGDILSWAFFDFPRVEAGTLDRCRLLTHDDDDASAQVNRARSVILLRKGR